VKHLRSLWAGLKPTTRNAIIAARNVAGWTFLVSFGGASFGFVQKVTEWASASGQDPFPEVSVLGYAFVAAVGAAATGAFAGIVRWAQGRFGAGKPPSY
jgi:hypothetical protein